MITWLKRRWIGCALDKPVNEIYVYAGGGEWVSIWKRQAEK